MSSNHSVHGILLIPKWTPRSAISSCLAISSVDMPNLIGDDLNNVIERATICENGKLKNKTFMITGKLNGISRAEVKSIIEENAGAVVSSVSKKLNYLIVGEKPTKRKVEAAKDLKISILDQNQFLPFFPMLKDPVKRIEQDYIWKKICKELEWEFIPTI